MGTEVEDETSHPVYNDNNDTADTAVVRDLFEDTHEVAHTIGANIAAQVDVAEQEDGGTSTNQRRNTLELLGDTCEGSKNFYHDDTLDLMAGLNLDSDSECDADRTDALAETNDGKSSSEASGNETNGLCQSRSDVNQRNSNEDISKL